MEKKESNLHFTSGLIFGTAVAAAAAFFYKTQTGQKLKNILAGYYNQAKDYLDEVVKQAKKQAKTKDFPEVVEKVARQEIKIAKKKKKTLKRKVFSQSGRPLKK